MFDWVQVWDLGGPLNDIETCLGCVLRVIVLLEGEPSPQSVVLSALEQLFFKDLSVFSSVNLYLRSGSTIKT